MSNREEFEREGSPRDGLRAPEGEHAGNEAPHRHRYTIALAAATVLLALFFWRSGDDLQPPSLSTVTSDAAGPIERGDRVHPGARLVLDARTGGTKQAQLRVYRDDVELVMKCGEEPPCARDGDRLTAEIVLERPGEYRSLLLLDDAALPAAGGTLEEDVAAATAAGAHVEIAAHIEVR